MRSRLASTCARLGVLALLTATGLLASPPAAQAAGLVAECTTSSIACISFSGYSGRSVWGYPVNSTGNNCVNYVAYRLARNGVSQQSGLGNGGSWSSSARARGFRVDSTPATGSIAQWNYGSHFAPRSGHVAYVEEVTSTYILISDSYWSGGSHRWRISRGDPNWPSTFIHFKDTRYQPPASGTFVQVRESGEVYRLHGATPIFISTWASVGGAKPTHVLSAASLASLPFYAPEGSYLRGTVGGAIYKIVGGAPLYVSSWANVGGPKPATSVDQASIDRAGAGGRLNHLRARPVNGTMIKTSPRGEVYTIAAGAPVYVSSWAQIGGPKPTITVDAAAVDRANSSTRYNHLAFRPVDNSYLIGKATGRVYKMSGGVAHYVTSWSQVGGPKPTLPVDQTSINMAGTRSPTKWTHILAKRTL